MIKQFKEGSRYLVGNKGYYNEALLELTVLEVSEKGIKIKYDNGNSQWYLKDKFPYNLIEELPIVKQTIENRSHEIQFKDDMWREKDEPDFTLRITEENDIKVKLKAEEKPKLEWQSNSSEQSMTWYEAVEYAKSLGDGWRLPTIEELIDSIPSNNIHRNFYWSSIEYAQYPYFAWYIDLNYKAVFYSNKKSIYYTRCVRHKLI